MNNGSVDATKDTNNLLFNNCGSSMVKPCHKKANGRLYEIANTAIISIKPSVLSSAMNPALTGYKKRKIKAVKIRPAA